ncbi:MAG: hypothetical protein FWG09_04990, partial [Synergistaceae bacterium]|nr:hypothetical protein [Synergistaceae bacterium]
MRKFWILLFFILMAGESFGANVTADDKRRSLDAARHASILLRDGRFEEALVEYKKAEELNPDEKLSKIIEEIRAKIIEEAENKAMADTLRKQAVLHIADGHLDLAMEKFEKSLTHYDNPDVRYELAVVEGRFKAETQKQRTAQEMFRISEQLELRGELDAALSKLEEAQAIWNLPQILPLRQKIQSSIGKREADNAEASKLAEEAIALELRANTGQVDIPLLEQALEKFKKSYAIVPAPAVEMAIIQTEQN